MLITNPTISKFIKWWNNRNIWDNNTDDYDFLIKVSPSYFKWTKSEYFPSNELLYKYINIYPSEATKMMNEINPYLKRTIYE